MSTGIELTTFRPTIKEAARHPLRDGHIIWSTYKRAFYISHFFLTMMLIVDVVSPSGSGKLMQIIIFGT